MPSLESCACLDLKIFKLECSDTQSCNHSCGWGHVTTHVGGVNNDSRYLTIPSAYRAPPTMTALMAVPSTANTTMLPRFWKKLPYTRYDYTYDEHHLPCAGNSQTRIL